MKTRRSVVSAYDSEMGDFKRNAVINEEKMELEPEIEENDGRELEHDEIELGTNNDKVNEYMQNLLKEKLLISEKYPLTETLLNAEIERTQQTGRTPGRDARYVNIYREKPIKVVVKVLVPVREHPKFNFVGKLLGPKGNSMRRLQEETMCRMSILGRGSMRDKATEDELRAQNDSKNMHLNEELHVEITASGPPAEAHARIAYALAEVRKYLIPDSNDDIRQEQLREMMIEAPEKAERKKSQFPSMSAAHSSHGYPPHSGHPTHGSSPGHRPVMTPKNKILSILDKARTAMDDSHSKVPAHAHGHVHAHHPQQPPHAHSRYEEARYEEPMQYEAYPAYHHGPPARPKYEAPTYEPEYRRDYYREPPTYAAAPPPPHGYRPAPPRYNYH